MNRSKPEESCRRMEFKCRLYEVIKELDTTLKSECGHAASPPSQQIYEQRNQPNQVWNNSKNKGSECCCPPGCCKQSMEFRMPRLPPKEMYMTDSDQVDTRGAEDSAQAQGHHSEYTWHNEDHSGGCRPVSGEQHQQRQQPSAHHGLRFPQTPEEAIQMGCIVARSS